MAIEKYNLYMPGQNLTSLALNVDINRIGIDKVNIDVNYGTVPATVTIKEGSIIEVNGNLYVITGSDYSFQMANAAHNYITFTDNPSPAFGSAAVEGTYSNDKKAYYQADNVTRTLGWFIDQTISEHFIYLIRQTQVINPDLMLDRVTVGMSGNQAGPANPVQFNVETEDRLGNYDIVNYRFIAKYAGTYVIGVNLTITSAPAPSTLYASILKNGVAIATYINSPGVLTGYPSGVIIYPLLVGDIITFSGSAIGGHTIISSSNAYISRIL